MRFVVGLLAVGTLLLHLRPATADMYQDAGNAKLPEAPANLGLGYAVKAGGNIQTGLTAAQSTGGLVTVGPGTYNISTPLVIGSNTQIKCQAGATIHAVYAGWTAPTRPMIGSPTYAAIANLNNAVAVGGAIIDRNITVEGCNFTTDFAHPGPAGGFHFIELRHVGNARIVGNRATGGGDLISGLAVDGVWVDGNYHTGSKNACYDFWEGPQNVTVSASNYCESINNCLMATGTDTNYGAGTARNIKLSGTCRITGSAAGAAVWFNGLSHAPALSGVIDSVIDSPLVYYDDPTVLNTCIKVSGGTTERIQVIAPICRGGSITVGGDVGGFAKDVVVTSPYIDQAMGGPGHYPLLIGGTGVSAVKVTDPRIRKGAATYTHAVVIETGATGTVVTGTQGIEAGSVSGFSDSGTNSRIEGVYPASAGAGGLFVCVDTAGVMYKKATCP